MARGHALQTSFSSGVLDPKLKARTDLQHYYNGASVGENVVAQPQGGFVVRHGTKYLAQALATTGRTIPFVFNDTEEYLLLFTENRIQFFRDDALITNINGSGNDYLVTTYTAAQVQVLDFAQSADTMILFHESHQQRTLVRGATDADWTLAAITWRNIPQFDYNDASSPTPTSYVGTVTFTGFTEGDQYKLVLNDFETENITYSATASENQRRIRDQLIKLPPTGFVETDITVTGGPAYVITMANGSASDYEAIQGFQTQGTGGTITGVITTPGVSRREDIFSATRGYPRCGTFFDGRLYQFGLTSIPDREIASQIGDFFNLDVGEGFDDEAIDQSLNTNDINEIRYCHPGRALQVFSSKAEFYHPDRPVTPAKAALPRQTKYGVAQVKPTEIDGATLFVTRHGKTLREFVFSQNEQAYTAGSLSIMANHLLDDVKAMDAVPGTSADESNYVFLVNNDGSVAVLNTMREQDLTAWTSWPVGGANGRVQWVTVVDEDVYFLVLRNISGTDVLYLEKWDSSLRTDSALTFTFGSDTTAITGLGHLEGQTVRVKGDGSVQESQTVSGGAITAAVAATSFEVGLDYKPKIRPMPLNVDLGFGALLGRTKRLVDIAIQVKDTLGVTVDGDLLPDRQLDVDTFDALPTPITGVKKIDALGWTEGDLDFEISQDDPLPFNILGFNARVEVNEV